MLALAEHVALADDPRHRAARTPDEEGADAVLHQDGDRIEHGLLEADRVHVGSLDLEDVA